jgi:hypothetical protein
VAARLSAARSRAGNGLVASCGQRAQRPDRPRAPHHGKGPARRYHPVSDSGDPERDARSSSTTHREDPVTTPEACVMCFVTSDAPLPVIQATVIVAPWVFRSNFLRVATRIRRRVAARRRALRRARQGRLP